MNFTKGDVKNPVFDTIRQALKREMDNKGTFLAFNDEAWEVYTAEPLDVKKDEEMAANFKGAKGFFGGVNFLNLMNKRNRFYVLRNVETNAKYYISFKLPLSFDAEGKEIDMPALNIIGVSEGVFTYFKENLKPEEYARIASL